MIDKPEIAAKKPVIIDIEKGEQLRMVLLR